MAPMAPFQPFLREAKNLLFQPLCWGCGRPGVVANGFCWECARALYRAARPGDHLLPHEGPVAGLLRAMRGQAPVLAASWGLRLLRITGRLQAWRAGGVEIVLPAPQNPRPGGSGLELLAESVARELGAGSHSRAFAKAKGRTQHGRDRRGRMDTECFLELALPGSRIAGRHVLVLDDVSTTGTTLELCAFSLRRAGAREVATFALAEQAPQAASGSRRSLRP